MSQNNRGHRSRSRKGGKKHRKDESSSSKQATPTFSHISEEEKSGMNTPVSLNSATTSLFNQRTADSVIRPNFFSVPQDTASCLQKLGPLIGKGFGTATNFLLQFKELSNGNLKSSIGSEGLVKFALDYRIEVMEALDSIFYDEKWKYEADMLSPYMRFIDSKLNQDADERDFLLLVSFLSNQAKVVGEYLLARTYYFLYPPDTMDEKSKSLLGNKSISTFLYAWFLAIHSAINLAVDFEQLAAIVKHNDAIDKKVYGAYALSLVSQFTVALNILRLSFFLFYIPINSAIRRFTFCSTLEFK
jgi:hypothetical protein